MISRREELIRLIDDKFEKKISQRRYHSNGVKFVIFDSFLVKCTINIEKEELSTEIDLGFRNIIAEFQGMPFVSGLKESEIIVCLNQVEACCHTHLLDKFLIAKGWKDGASGNKLREKNYEIWQKEHSDFIEFKRNNRNDVGFVKNWAFDFIHAAKSFFGNRISGIEITKIEESHPRENAFYLKFRMYDYFDMTGGGGTSLGWEIRKGEYFIDLPTSQHWFGLAHFDEFFKDMQEELELRLPDDYLKKNA